MLDARAVVVSIFAAMPAATASAAPTRATPVKAPHIDVACLSLPSEVDAADAPALPAHCRDDHGFPAISRDGKSIARLYNPEEGAARYVPLLALEIVDAATSRVVHTELIVDEADTDRAVIAKRLAKLTRTYRLASYRTLVPVDDTSELRLERDEDSDEIRLVDRATNVDRARVELSGAISMPTEPTARAAANPDAEPSCHISGRASVQSFAWDAATRTAVITASFSTMPCYCPVPSVLRAIHVPRR